MQRVYSRPTHVNSRPSRAGANGAGSSQERRPRPLPPPKKDEAFPASDQRSGGIVEYAVRVPKQANGRGYHAMKFNANLNIDVRQWSKVNMVRENNLREFKAALQEEEMPKFGAGSEYGRDAREEARRRKYGRMTKKYSPEDQPWLMKVGGKGGKKFRGVREGGVTENASYYVLMQSTSTSGVFEAYPVQHWYNFTPIQRFKALTAEEAEEEFGRRNKIMNYFSVMVKKKLKTEGEEEGGAGEDDEGKKKGGKKAKAEKSNLKISEMDEWIDSEDESDDESDEEGKAKKKKKEEDSEDDGKKKKGKKGQKKKKKEKSADSEAEEESDDGDEEGREMDYDSESSASEEELETKMAEKGVDEEGSLRKILGSDSEDEDEEEKKDEDEEEGDDKKEGKDDKKEDGKSSQGGEGKAKEKKGKAKKGKKEAEKGATSRDNSGDSSEFSESEVDKEANSLFQKKGKGSKSASENNSRSSSPPMPPQDGGGRGEKRKADDSNSVGQQLAKKLKPDGGEKMTAANSNLPPGVLQAAVDAGITEEAVTRYLMRKPMTAKELLLKFKSKKTGISSDHMVMIIAQILQRLNLEKRKVRDAMYFSLKS